MKTLWMLILSLGATRPATALPQTRDALDALGGVLGNIAEKRVFKGLTPWKEPCEVRWLPDARAPGEFAIRTSVNGRNQGAPEVALASGDHIEKLVDDREHGLVEVEAYRKSSAREAGDRRVRLHVQRYANGDLAFVVRDERWGWFPLPHVEQARCIAR